MNAVEPGTEVPIHRHPTKDDTFMVLRGRVWISTFNDEAEVIDSIVRVVVPYEVDGILVVKG